MSTPAPPPPARSDYVLAALPVVLVAMLLYANTLLPDVGLWDTAEFQTIGPVLGTAHPTGYPTYTLLAWLGSVLLQPFGNEAYRADLLSAVLMAGAAGLVAVRAVQATRHWPLGLVGGLAFALTPVAWRWGLRADPHALHAFLAALLLVMLAAWARRHDTDPGRAARWLIAAAIVYGLSLGNHALTLLLAPGIAAYVLMAAPRILWQEWRLVVGAGAALVLTTVLVYLYLPLRSAMEPALDYADPETWDAFWYVVLGEQFQGAFRLPAMMEVVGGMWNELMRDFGIVSVLALAGALLGLVRHPRLTVLTLLWFACTWLFAVGYPNASIERYYLVPLLAASLWIVLAMDAARDAVSALLWRPGRESLGRAAVAVLVVAVLLVVVAPVPPRYSELDASGDDRGRTFMEATFGAVEDDAVVISWWSFSTPLWYGRWVEGRRADVTIVDDRDIIDDGYGSVEAAIERYLDERPVYVIRRERDLARLREHYELEVVPGVPAALHRVIGAVKAE